MTLIRLFCLLFLLGFPFYGAVDNSIVWHELSGSDQTTLPNRTRVWFFPGEIPSNKWVRPFPGGTGASTWQAHHLTYYSAAWCTAMGYPSICNGSVQSMQVFWTHNVTANAVVTISFRLSDVPCSGGSTTEAECASAGLSLGGFLSAWPSGEDVSLEYTTTGTTGVTHTQSIRAMLADNNACVVYAGPAVTVLDIGWSTGSGQVCSPITTRPYAFGFTQKRVFNLSSQVDTTATTWPIYANSEVTGLSFPQDAWIDNEKISITGAASSTSITVTRAQGGTSAAYHSGSIYLVDGKPTLSVAFDPSVDHTFQVNDASTLTSGDIVRIREAWHRTCNKTSNTMQLGHASVPCAEDVYHTGRYWYGGRGDYATVPVGYPVVKFEDDMWLTATSNSQKSLSPRAFAYKWTGRNGIGVQAVTMNTWEDRKQTQVYNLVVKIGGTTVATRNIVNHVGYSMVVYPDGPDIASQGTYISDGFMWTSNTPGQGSRDHNLPWLRAVGATQIDPGETFDINGYNHFFTGGEVLGNGQIRPGWEDSSKGTMSTESWLTIPSQRSFDSFWIRDEGGGGSYGGLGETSSWQAGGIKLMGLVSTIANAKNWGKLVFGTAISGFHAPIYAHSSSVSGTFCNNSAQGTTQEPGPSCDTVAYQSIVPFGRPMFSDHTPTFTAVSMTTLLGVGRVTTGGWTHNYSFGSSHWFNYFTLPYILQADPLWKLGVESNVASAHTFSYLNNAFNASATTYFDLYRQNRGASGIAQPSSGVRGPYITIRLLGLGGAILPSSPEKEIILSKYENNLAVREGAFGMTGGNYYNPCTSTKDCSFWRFGAFTRGWDSSVTNSSIPMIEGPAACTVGDTTVNASRVYFPAKPFMYLYLPLALKAHIGLGLHQGLPLYKHVSRVPVNIALNTNAHSSAGTGIGIMTSYGSPDVTMLPEGVDSNCGAQGTIALGTNPAFTNWAHYFKGWDSTTRDPAFRGLTDEYPNLTRDRIFLYRASIGGNYMVPIENLSMKKAWEVISIRAKMSTFTLGYFAIQTGINYRWSPDWWHTLKDVTIVPGVTTARIVFTRPDTATSCGYSLGSSSFSNSSDSGDTTTATGKLEHIINLSSLSPSTTYYVRLQCEDASESRIGRWYGTFTTE